MLEEIVATYEWLGQVKESPVLSYHCYTLYDIV
jgi:hypothetical protein